LIDSTLNLQAQELHRSRACAYKWYKRHNDEGIEGLRDRHRSGKPSVVSTDTKEKIRQELSDSNTGWDFRQAGDGPNPKEDWCKVP
jgi:transposase